MCRFRDWRLLRSAIPRGHSRRDLQDHNERWSQQREHLRERRRRGDDARRGRAKRPRSDCRQEEGGEGGRHRAQEWGKDQDYSRRREGEEGEALFG